MAVLDWMLLPDTRIRRRGKERIEVVGPKRPQLEKRSVQYRLEGKGQARFLRPGA